MILEWLTKHRRWVITGCVIILIFTILVEVFRSYFWASSILDYFQHWSLALSAGATLALAYIAYISILENRRIREEERERAIKTRALAIVRNWVFDSLELITLNAQYTDEHRREEFDFGRHILYKIQDAKTELLRKTEEVLHSATLFGPQFFSLVDEGFNTLKGFIEQGMAENPNITEQYKKSFGLLFANILKAIRETEDSELNLRT